MRKINRYRIKKYRELTLPISYVIGTGEKILETTKDIALRLSNGETIIIPKGFRFDGASVPRAFWWFIPKLDDRILAVLGHDYLYYSDYLRNKKSDKEAKAFIDDEFLIWMDIQMDSWVSKCVNFIAYLAVKYFGWRIFNKKKETV